MQRSELERGYTYLRRFKTLSRAFATGDLRAVHLAGASPSAESIPGPWQKIPLYKQLEDVSLAIAKIYEPSGTNAGAIQRGGPDVDNTSLPNLAGDETVRRKIQVYAAADSSEVCRLLWNNRFIFMDAPDIRSRQESRLLIMTSNFTQARTIH